MPDSPAPSLLLTGGAPGSPGRTRKHETLARQREASGQLISLDRKALVQVVREMRASLLVMQATWAPAAPIAAMFHAIKALIQDKPDKAVVFLEEGVKDVPDSLRFIKTVMLVRALRYHRIPRGKKERSALEKRVADLRAYLQVSDDLHSELALLDESAAVLFPAGSGSAEV